VETEVEGAAAPAPEVAAAAIEGTTIVTMETTLGIIFILLGWHLP
jgi:hypothetical protein